MRTTTRPMTALCTLAKYMGFLISEPKSPTCTRFAEVTGISHDTVNRFLHRENYSPKDLFKESDKNLCLQDGTLSVDDSVIDKPYCQYIELFSHFWSGKHHKVSQGVNLITLYYTDPNGCHRARYHMICRA